MAPALATAPRSRAAAPITAHPPVFGRSNGWPGEPAAGVRVSSEKVPGYPRELAAAVLPVPAAESRKRRAAVALRRPASELKRPVATAGPPAASLGGPALPGTAALLRPPPGAAAGILRLRAAATSKPTKALKQPTTAVVLPRPAAGAVPRPKAALAASKPRTALKRPLTAVPRPAAGAGPRPAAGAVPRPWPAAAVSPRPPFAEGPKPRAPTPAAAPALKYKKAEGVRRASAAASAAASAMAAFPGPAPEGLEAAGLAVYQKSIRPQLEGIRSLGFAVPQLSWRCKGLRSPFSRRPRGLAVQGYGGPVVKVKVEWE